MYHIIAISQKEKSGSSNILDNTLIVKQLSVEEGLAQSMVTMVFRDEDGFAWIGTGGGLHFFNGEKFDVFRHQQSNPESLPDNIVRDMQSLGNKKYLVTTSTAISVFDKVKGTFKPLVKTEKRESIPLKIQRNGSFLFWTEDAGFFWLSSHKIIPIKLLRENEIVDSSIFSPVSAVQTDSSVIIIGNHHLLEVKFKNQQEAVILRSQFEEKQLQIGKRNNNIYLAIDNSIYKYKRNGKTEKITTSPTGEISLFYIDKTNTFWITDVSENKVFTYNQKEGWKQVLLTSRVGRFVEHLHPYIKFIFEDNQNCIWIGTDGKGVLLYQPNQFDFKKTEIGFTTAITSTRNNVWAGTWKKGLYRLDYNLQQKQQIVTKSISKNDRVFHLYSDGQNRVWAITKKGLSVIQENGESSLFYPLAFANAKVWEVAKDTVIVSTSENAYLFYSGENIHLIKEEKSYFIADLLKVEDQYWMCSRDGVFLSKRPFATPSNRISDVATHRLLRENDNIWLCRKNGVALSSIKNQQFKEYDYSEYLPDNKIYAMLEDEETNSIWLTTDNGIWKLEHQTGELKYFDMEYNLQSIEFNSGAFHKAKNGMFLYGGIEGVNSFYPEEYREYSKRKEEYLLKRIVLQINRKDDKILLAEDQSFVKLAYDNSGFSGSVATGDYEKSNLHEYTFLLKNYDVNWSVPTNNRTFSFGKLPPGNYTLLAKYKNAYNTWSNPTQVLDIMVPVPFWKSTWFNVVFSFIILISIVFLVRYFQYRKLKRAINDLEQANVINQERLRIARDLHDELGAELSHIYLLANNETEDINLKSVSEKIKSLGESLKHVIWLSDPESDCLSDLQAVAREYISDFSEKANWKCYFEKWEEYPTLKIDADIKRNLLLIVKECLNNTLKHANADSIYLSWEYVLGKLHFSYTDNGQGLPKNEKYKNGRGLDNIKKRSKDTGATVLIKNCPIRGGFTLLLTLKIK